MTLFGSGFLITLIGVNICLAYSVYPTALLGRVSVAPVGYMAIGAYAAAWFTMRGMPFVYGLGVGIAIAAILSMILAVVAGHLRSHFFVAASLGVALIVQQLAFSLKDVTGGYLGLSTPDGIAQSWHIWIAAFACIVASFSLRHSSIDRSWRAIGSDDAIAGALGISVRRALLTASLSGALVAALAGALYGHLIAFFDPTSFGLNLLLLLVAAVVLGGVSDWYGPLLGAIIMTVLPELLHGAGPWRTAVTGMILIACVLFLPRGLSDSRSIVALSRNAAAWMRRRRNGA
jgi:branched-chain amino acid transport system permease protein